jgi:hypothetical protein
LPASPEADALGGIPAFAGAKRIELGPTVRVTVETALPVGVDPEDDFPSWRATVERGETRVVILSDGAAAAHFAPGPLAAVVAVAGEEPVTGWELAPAVALVANASAIDGPDLRSAFAGGSRAPEWYGRVHRGEALRLRFVEEGIALPADAIQPLASPAASASSKPKQPSTAGWSRG